MINVSNQTLKDGLEYNFITFKEVEASRTNICLEISISNLFQHSLTQDSKDLKKEHIR